MVVIGVDHRLDRGARNLIGMIEGGSPRLARELGTLDAVVIGLSAMFGAGVFAVFGPAAEVAGPLLMVGLLLAAVIAYCNATSTARLAALYPVAGGAYVYGRQRLGDFWGHLAGWSFVVGKTASCAAMALTVGHYLCPDNARSLAALAIVCLTVLNQLGVRAAAWFSRALVVGTLIALGVVVLSALTAPMRPARLIVTGVSADDLWAIPQSAGLIFFAFAGYARIATLGEEVRDPRRTIPRAVTIALAVALITYTAVAVSALLAVGAETLATAEAPLITVTLAGGLAPLGPVVAVGAVLAALGSLLALILGASRTAFAMARDGHLWTALSRVEPRRRVPRRAEAVVGAVALIMMFTLDLRSAIGFSSFGVLIYYAIANAAARTMTDLENRPPRWVPILGLLGCLTLVTALPITSVLAGSAVTALGAALWWFRRDPPV